MKYSLILLVSLATFTCKKAKPTVSPSYQNLTEAVYASGNIYPNNEYKLMANADGFLTQQLATEGDLVEANQLLFSIESTAQDARSEASNNILKQAEENVSGQSAILKELEVQVKMAKSRLNNDAINFERYQDLFEKNATTKIEYEKAKLVSELSKEDFKAKELMLSRTKNQLYVDLQNAKANARVNGREGQNFKIKTFEAGEIFELYKKRGELVRRGEALALIGDATQQYIQLNVDEADLAKIKIGQNIILKVDVYADKVFKAKIQKIYPKLNKADQTFRVDAVFEGEKPTSYYGLSVESNIIISENPKALTLPKDLVTNDSVWVQDGDKPKRIKIETGAHNLELIEIKSGLSASSKVLKD